MVSRRSKRCLMVALLSGVAMIPQALGQSVSVGAEAPAGNQAIEILSVDPALVTSDGEFVMAALAIGVGKSAGNFKGADLGVWFVENGRQVSFSGHPDWYLGAFPYHRLNLAGAKAASELVTCVSYAAFGKAIVQINVFDIAQSTYPGVHKLECTQKQVPLIDTGGKIDCKSEAALGSIREALAESPT
jgi:hypothetical protein